MSKNKEETTNNIHTSLKVLCYMSLVGFIISLITDIGNYISFGSIEELKKMPNQEQYEILENSIEKWGKAGVDVSKRGVEKISNMYFIRGFVDILAMVGVVFMYFKLKIGYVIYTIFQFVYVSIPFLFFGGFALLIVPYSSVAITLIYVALFTTQRKYLDR